MVTAQLVRVRLTALGVPVEVRLSGGGAASAADAVRSAWAWCLRGAGVADSSSAAGGSVEAADVSAAPLVVEAFLDSSEGAVAGARAEGVAAWTSLPPLMDWLSPAVTTAAITHLAGQLLMLHACALADPVTGATVALVGPSGMGKTTLSRTLGKSFGYVTDETVALRADGTLLPYPKPLSVRWFPDDVVKEQVSPSRVGLLEPPSSLRLVGMLLLDRREDAPAVPEVSEVPLVFALARLAEQCSFLARMSTPLQQMAGVLNDVGGLRQVTYREAGDLEPLLGEMVGAAS